MRIFFIVSMILTSLQPRVFGQVLWSSIDNYTVYKYDGFSFNNNRWGGGSGEMKVWRNGDSLGWSNSWGICKEWYVKGAPLASIGDCNMGPSSWANNSVIRNVKIKDIEYIKGDWTFTKPVESRVAGYPHEQYHFYFQLYLSNDIAGQNHKGDIAIVLYDHWFYHQPTFGSPITINRITYDYQYIPNTGHGNFLIICLPKSFSDVAPPPDANNKFNFTQVDIDGIIKWGVSKGWFNPEWYLTHLSTSMEVMVMDAKTLVSNDMKFVVKAIGQNLKVAPTWKTGASAVLDPHNDRTTATADFTLEQNYPNPFNPSTTIGFTLEKKEHAALHVFNTLGQPVATLADQVIDAGSHTVLFNAQDMPSGVYFYKLVTSSGNFMRKAIFIQ